MPAPSPVLARAEGAAMIHVAEHAIGVEQDLVRGAALDVGHEAPTPQASCSCAGS